MKNKLFFLSVLVLFTGLVNRINAQENKVNTASDTLVVMWSSADPDIADKVCLMYTQNAKKWHWFEEVILIVWGPSQKTLAENEKLQERIKTMKEEGVILEACVYCSKMLGVEDDLKECGIDVKGMGVPLTKYLKRGYKMLYF